MKKKKPKFIEPDIEFELRKVHKVTGEDTLYLTTVNTHKTFDINTIIDYTSKGNINSIDSNSSYFIYADMFAVYKNKKTGKILHKEFIKRIYDKKELMEDLL